MALTTQERIQTSEALGLDTDPVQVDIEAPVPDLSPTAAQIAEAQGPIDPAEKTSFFEAFGASFRVDNSASALARSITSAEFQFDVNFDSTALLEDENIKERIDALTFADRDEVIETLAGSYNSDHLESVLSRFEGMQQDEITIAKAGTTKGLIARLAANVLDPVDLAVTAAAAPFGVAVKAKKLGRILTIATTAGVSNAAVEALVAKDNPFRDGTDVAFAGLAGITLGGALGTLLSRGENLRIERAANDLARSELDSVGAARRVLDEGDGSPDAPLRPTAEERLDEIIDGEAPEFRQFPVLDLMRNTSAFFSVPIAKVLFKSKVGEVRALASKLLEGGFSLDKSKTRVFTAEGRADAIERSFMSTMMNTTEPDFKAWAKSKGFNAPRRVFGIQAGGEFYEDVSKALRGLEGASEQAVSAAAKVRPLLDDLFETAQKLGVKGFDKDGLDNFFPRVYNKNKFRAALKRFGETNVSTFFREAIISNADDLSEELAGKIAKGMVRSIRTGNSGVEGGLMNGIPLNDLDELSRILGDTPDARGIIKELEAIRAKRTADGGTISTAKRRVRLDEGFSSPIRTLDGDTVVLALTDLTENDTRRVLGRYVQVMAGNIGLAKEVGIKSRADFDRAVDAVASRAESQGENFGQAERQAFDKAYKALTGQSLEDDVLSTGSQLSRVARDINFTRLSGSFGVAQLEELSNLVGLAGWRGFIRKVPELLTITRRAADGTLDNRVAAQAERWFGPGTDFETHPALRAFDDIGEGFDEGTALGRTLTAFDGPLQIAKRSAAQLSLMAPMNARMEKMAAIMHVEDLSDVALGISKVSDARRARWRGAGLTDEMQDRVVAQIKQHAEFKGKKLVDLNADRWDADVEDTFASSLRRQASFTIQRNDINDLPEGAYKAWGRTLLQFKSFMFGSVTKQLERGINYQDVEQASSLLAGLFFAGTGFVAQTVIVNANNPEKIAELLTPERIAAAAVQRVGDFALLIPFAELGAFATGNSLFNARTSGLSSTFGSLDSNPTSQLVSDLFSTTKGLTSAVVDENYRFSQADLRRIYRLLPYHRVLGVKNALHLLEEELPEKSRR